MNKLTCRLYCQSTTFSVTSMWIFVVLFHVGIIFGIETMVVGPRNVAVIVGQRMEMKCQVHSDWTVRGWKILRTSNQTEDKLFANWGSPARILNAHFGVDDKDFGPGGILYANSTTLDDAGIYICSVQQGIKQLDDHNASLIVFETEPLCSSNSTLPLTAAAQEETYSVWMRCTVNFRGNLIPDVEWRKHIGSGEEYNKGHEITNLADTVIIPNSTITSELTAAVSIHSTSSLSYSFKIYFKSLTDDADNAANYSYIWKLDLDLPGIDISSKPTDLDTDPAIILMALVLSVLSALTVVVIIRCIRHRRSDMASEARSANIPDVANSQREILSDPLYSEVRPNEMATVTTKTRTPGSAAHESHDSHDSRPLKYFGDDGTEYMEVNAMGRQPMPVRPPVQPNNMFSVVGDYAFIDHTPNPPIPPRGNNT